MIWGYKWYVEKVEEHGGEVIIHVVIIGG